MKSDTLNKISPTLISMGDFCYLETIRSFPDIIGILLIFLIVTLLLQVVSDG